MSFENPKIRNIATKDTMKRMCDVMDDDVVAKTKQSKLEFSKEALMYSTVAGDRKKVLKLLDLREGRNVFFFILHI